MANRLEFLLVAKADGLQKGLRDAEVSAKQTAKGISDALKTASGGPAALVDALESANFQKVAAEARAASSTVQKSFSKTGADLKAAFAQASDTGLPEGFDRAKRAASEFSNSARKDLGGVEKAIDGLADQVGELGRQVGASKLGDLAEGARSLADRVSGLGETFSDAGEEIRLADQELRKIFTDPADVTKFSAAVRELKGEFEGLKGEEIVEGIGVLERFGVAGEKELRRVTNAAQVAQKGIADIAEPYAEFKATLAQGGDFGALEELRVLLGVGSEELKKFGAVVKDGKVLGDTPEQWERAKVALDAYLDSTARFQNVSERSQDNISKLSTEIDKLNTGIGEGTNALKEYVAGGLVDAVEYLNTFSDSTKTAVGTVAEGAGILGQGAAKVAEIGAYSAVTANSVKGLAASMTAAQVATATAVATTGAFVIGIGAAIAGIGLILKSLYDMTVALDQAENAQKRLMETQRLALEMDADRGRLAKLSVTAILAEAEAIEDAGKRRALVTDAIIGKEAEAAIAREKGQTDQAAKLEAEAKALKKQRVEYDQAAEAVTRAEAAKTKATEESSKAQAKSYAADAKAHEDAQKKKVEDAARAAEERLKVEERLAKEEESLRRNALRLDGDKVDAASAEIAALDAKLAKGEDVGKQIERELKGRAQTQKALIDAEAALDRVAIKQAALADAAANPELADRIQKNAAEKERQLDQATASAKAKVDRQLASDQESLATKAAGFAKARIDAEKEAATKKLELEKQWAALTLQAMDQQQAAETAAYAERRKHLEDETAAGIDRRVELAKLDDEQAAAERKRIDERSKAEIAAIERRRAAENQGASADQQALNNERARLDIMKAQAAAKTAANAIVNQSLQAAKDELSTEEQKLKVLQAQSAEKKKSLGFDTSIKGGAQSVEEAFGSNASGFGVSRSNREVGASTEDGPTEKELQASIARRKADIARREAAAKKGQAQAAPVSSPTAGKTSTNGAAQADGTATVTSAGGQATTPASGALSATVAPLVVAVNQLVSLLQAQHALGDGQAPQTQYLANIDRGQQQILQELRNQSGILGKTPPRQPSTLGNEFARGAGDGPNYDRRARGY